MLKKYLKSWKDISPRNILRGIHWQIIMLVLSAITILAMSIPQKMIVNENQILYYMSCLAQVMAALFALILTAYTIADARLKDKASNDETLIDYIPELQNEYYGYIKMISVECMITILGCFIMINTYTELPQRVFSALIIDIGVLGGISVVSLVLFTWAMCDPKAYQQKGEAVKEEIDQAYVNNTTNDFRTFLGSYNKLENLIERYASEILDSVGDNRMPRKQMLILQALEILMSNGIINECVYVKVDEFRQYRNALVHSKDPGEVNGRIYNELEQVFELFNDIYSHRKAVEEKNDCIIALSKYCEENLLSELDKKIIKYLQEQKNDKLKYSDIAKAMNITKGRTLKIIKKLKYTGKLPSDIYIE